MADAKDAAWLRKAIVYEPRSGGRCGEAVVIWLHGWGDAPEGWAFAFGGLRRAHPTWKWIFLRAPLLPQTCEDGKECLAWGDFLDSGCVGVGSPDYENPDAKGYYARSVAEVHRLVDSLAADGVPPGRIVIGGHSQGSATALMSTLTYGHRLAGCVVLSGWMLPRSREALSRSVNRGLPYLHCHGTKDDYVGYDCGEAAVDAMGKAGSEVTFKVFEGKAHVAGYRGGPLSRWTGTCTTPLGGCGECLAGVFGGCCWSSPGPLGFAGECKVVGEFLEKVLAPK